MSPRNAAIRPFSAAGALAAIAFLAAIMTASPARAQAPARSEQGPARAEETGSDAAGGLALLQFNGRFHPVIGTGGMVSAQDALAAEVGRDILKEGGNAVDAAVATGFALAVTHPQAGNIGGGGFLLAYLAGEEKLVALDFREKAPAAASRDMFLGEDGAVDNQLARFSHLSAGVPGAVMGYARALEKYGTMSLEEVMAPAIRLAEEGFEVPYALNQSLSRVKARFARDPSSQAYFLTGEGEAPAVGSIFRQEDLAATLRAIAAEGPAGFYEGPVADLIVAEMEANGGLITHEDLKAYEAVEREAVRGDYRGYEIVSMPPPSSGGVHVVQMLNILEGFDLKALGHNSADYIHRLVEAMRRAYADRSEYLGDPDFFDVPIGEITDRAYAKKLREDIDLERAGDSEKINPGLGPAGESEETTHFSIMDRFGNAVAVTTTLNFSYGAGYSVDGAGFLLNNEMDDFSSKKGVRNAYGLLGGEANAIEPGKRPLSSMTPTIVMKDGAPFLVTGSPGGSTIITVVMQIILNMIDFDMNPMQATAAPRIHHQWKPDVVIAEDGVSRDTLRELERRGFVIYGKSSEGYARRLMGRANTIMRRGAYFYGAADPRGPKSGVATFELDPATEE